MICKYCGQEVTDNSTFCTACGTPIETGEMQGLPKNKSSKRILPILLIVAVIAIILKLVVFAENYETPLKNIVSVLNKKETNVDKIADAALPAIMMDTYKDCMKVLKDSEEYGDDVKDLLEDLPDTLEKVYEEVYEALEEEYGEKVKFSYEITDKEKLSKDERESIAEAYQELATLGSGVAALVEGLEDCTELEDKEIKELVKIVEKLEKKLDKYKVTAGYILDVEFTIKGKDDEEVSDEIQVVVTKVDGHWGIDYLVTPLIMSGDVELDEIGELMKDSDFSDANKELKAAAKEMDQIEEDIIEFALEMLEEGLDEMESIDENMEKSRISKDKMALDVLYDAIMTASGDTGFDVDYYGYITIDIRDATLSIRDDMEVGCVDRGSEDDFLEAIVDYIGSDEITLSAKCFEDGVDIEVGFYDYGMPYMVVTAKGNDDSGDFTINR